MALHLNIDYVCSGVDRRTGNKENERCWESHNTLRASHDKRIGSRLSFGTPPLTARKPPSSLWVGPMLHRTSPKPDVRKPCIKLPITP